MPSGKIWKENELTEAAKHCSSIKELAVYLNVSISSIYCRSLREGFSLKKRYARTKEQKIIYMRDYYRKNKNSFDHYAKKWRKNKRLDLIEEFGGKCSHCNVTNPILLDFDHIENDGHKDSKKNIVFRVKENPSRFQLLCKNCNWLKEYDRRQDKHAISIKSSG